LTTRARTCEGHQYLVGLTGRPLGWRSRGPGPAGWLRVAGTRPVPGTAPSASGSSHPSRTG